MCLPRTEPVGRFVFRQNRPFTIPVCLIPIGTEFARQTTGDLGALVCFSNDRLRNAVAVTLASLVGVSGRKSVAVSCLIEDSGKDAPIPAFTSPFLPAR